MAVPAPDFDLPATQKRHVKWMLYVGFIAMTVAAVNGLGQALNYAGVDILRWFPAMQTYYQGLTAHGVLMALVLTFSFANGFLALMTARALGRPLPTGLVVASAWSLFLGTGLAGFAIATGKASVLYTFYAPLKAHWTFYLGGALLVISTWLLSAALFVGLARWRRENPGQRIPLLAYISVLTFAMWDIASLGIGVEVVGFLLPWSLGIWDKIDPLLTRTLFWFSGHAIVYFWLLPAYVSWYALIPRQNGGRIFSDSLTRLVFLMFLCLSIPVGFHHQYADPGISSRMKFVHGVLTFGVFFPSLVTAFSVMAALENGGRNRGGKGLLGWIRKLSWGDPSVSAQLLAMLVFLLGGVTGLINASYSLNQVVHNTTFIPGHFHMTVGTAVALSIMGIAYWLVPWLTGRRLVFRGLAVAQGWVYSIGVLILARGLIQGGLEGMPRRSAVVASSYMGSVPDWHYAGQIAGVGGVIMFVGIAMWAVVIAGTVLFGRREDARDEIPVSETILPAATSGWEARLDHIRTYVFVAVILILIAYGPFAIGYLPPKMTAPGFGPPFF
jgi:cytochrome c oxidase subunit 1